ncbi:hypothetical protein GCM10011351_26850 [Paraliobacillus quinghaiensis]|uniref:Uncharacterized protein n=1 Tax=Paraliobacillus quinghaiensis TaxID=470815 RepID=A0A917TV25_9BACI|nr:hypothetical protein [Paraliobacillus quinghaiensis]GGM39331.1 hypothetical protein GCM10011351_26850 [Paraliobacillus quinghaiensis]
MKKLVFKQGDSIIKTAENHLIKKRIKRKVFMLLALLLLFVVGCGTDQAVEGEEKAKNQSETTTEDNDSSETSELKQPSVVMKDNLTTNEEETENTGEEENNEKEQQVKQEANKEQEETPKEEPIEEKKEKVQETDASSDEKEEPKEEVKERDTSNDKKEEPTEEVTEESKEEVKEERDTSNDNKEEVKSIIAFNKLFPIRQSNTVSSEQRLKDHNNTLEYPEMKYYVDQLNKGFGNWVKGAYNWDYRNTNNKSSYLAYRGGGYFYDGKPMSANEQYNAIYQKIKEYQFVINSSFNYKYEDIFVHSTRGGYTIHGVMSFNYTSNNGSKIEGLQAGKTYNVRVEVEMNYATLKSTDNWNFWNYGDYGLLTITDEHFVSSFN